MGHPTDPQPTEQPPSESEKRLHALFEGAAIGIGLVAFGDARWIDANDALCRLVGYSRAEMRATPWPAITHPADIDLDLIPFQRMAAGELDRYTVEKRFLHKQGHVVWARLTLSLIRKADGQPDYEIAIVEDITDRIRAAEAQARLAAIVASSDDAILSTSLDGFITSWNGGAERMFGWRETDMLGQSVRRMIPPDREDEEERMRSQLQAGRIVEHYETTRVTRDGRLLDISLTMSPTKDTDGRVTGASTILRDVSERKRGETTIRNSEQFLRRVLDNLFAFVGVMALDGTLLEANQAPIKAAGLVPSDVLGRKFWDCSWWNYSPDVQEGLKQAFRQALEGHIVRYDVPVRMAEDRLMWIDFQLAPLLDESGHMTHLVPSAMDITARREAERALRDSEARYAAIVGSAMDGIITIGPDQRIVLFNKAAERMFRCSADEAVGRRIERFIPERFRHDHERQVRRFGESGTTTRAMGRLGSVSGLRADGEEFPIEASISSIPTEQGPLSTVILRDVTERRKTEQTLRESESFYRQTLESIPGMVFTNRPDGACDYVSQQWVEFTGIPAHEQLAFGWVRVLHPDDRERALAAWHAAVEGRGRYDLEYRVRRKDGQYEWFKVRGQAIRDEQGHIVRWFGTAMSVEDLKRAEEALRRSKDELEARVHERTQQLIGSQQRLRALAAELTITEQRAQRALAKDLHDYLAQMLVVGRMKTGQMARDPLLSPKARTLSGEIDRLFDEALTYTRTMIAELSPPSFQESGLTAALQWLADRMAKDGLRVEVQAEREPLALPEEQAVLLFQSVRELLFNVLKHAESDQASVRVSRTTGNDLTIVVEDRGKGLSADALQRSAEPGHLGLFAVRERMEAMGGRLDLTSTPGRGTTATLTLPLGAAEPATQAKGSGQEASGMQNLSAVSSQHSAEPPLAARPSPLASPRIRVLLVDDHVLVREGIRTLLEQYADVTVVAEAGDGREALALAERLAPDVVLMDFNMPKMNGIEATKLITQRQPETVVIGLSVNDQEQVRREMVAAGAVDLLSKGAPPDDLYQLIKTAGRHFR